MFESSSKIESDYKWIIVIISNCTWTVVYIFRKTIKLWWINVNLHKPVQCSVYNNAFIDSNLANLSSHPILTNWLLITHHHQQLRYQLKHFQMSHAGLSQSHTSAWVQMSVYWLTIRTHYRVFSSHPNRPTSFVANAHCNYYLPERTAQSYRLIRFAHRSWH